MKKLLVLAIAASSLTIAGPPTLHDDIAAVCHIRIFNSPSFCNRHWA